jgi:hypothetical protein
MRPEVQRPAGFLSSDDHYASGQPDRVARSSRAAPRKRPSSTPLSPAARPSAAHRLVGSAERYNLDQEVARVNETVIHAPDIPGSIESVLDRLKPNGQGRQALLHANLLLTNLLALLRPIRIKKPRPGGPRTMCAAEKLGLELPRLRLLKGAVIRGIKEIENGDHVAARETFNAALDSWQEQKPAP